jgi:hypothetical protein
VSICKKVKSRNDSIVYAFPMKGIVFMPPAGWSERSPYRIRVDLKPRYSSISPVTSPDMHSRQVEGFS